MLVLSRKRNESIVIDGAIVVTVVDIRGDKVRLGIEAPRHVAVHRSEVYEALKKAAGEGHCSVVNGDAEPLPGDAPLPPPASH